MESDLSFTPAEETGLDCVKTATSCKPLVVTFSSTTQALLSERVRPRALGRIWARCG